MAFSLKWNPLKAELNAAEMGGVRMTPIKIYKVAASPWEVNEDKTILHRHIVLQTTVGERREQISIARARSSDGRDAVGVLFTTNFKVLESESSPNAPNEEGWLAAAIKHGDGILSKFVCQCSSIDQGSLLNVSEPEDVKSMVGALLSGLDLTIEFYGTGGLVDSIFVPGDDDFQDIFAKFWTRNNEAKPKKKWFGLYER